MTTAPGRLRARVARTILEQVLERVPVDVTLPDGTRLGPGPVVVPEAGLAPTTAEGQGEPTPCPRPGIDLVRPDSLFERLGADPKIGIGEAYVAGDWSPTAGTDLADALTPFAQRVATAVPRPWLALRRVVDRRLPRGQLNSPTGSRHNVQSHYDLSNDLFAAFLDETLTYSCALFDRSTPLAAQTLEAAQLRKVAAVLDTAQVGGGSSVLEIGTGWGTLALEAARRGARVTTVTLSPRQAELARRRVASAGLADRVDVRVEDYREITGRYDAVVSVEMLEAVGEEYWETYFGAIERRLEPGGRVALQTILMSHERLLATRRSYGWIQKHIFPGGLIPSLRAIEDASARSGLEPTSVRTFGQDYAETLRRWRSAFIAAWPSIAALGFDEAFRRTWEFYLAYCEAGFRAGYLDVGQLRLERARS